MKKTKSNSRLQIPTKFSELDLRGLIALGEILNGSDVVQGLADLCKISSKEAAILTNGTVQKIREALEESLPGIIHEYTEAYTSLDFVMGFDCPLFETWEIDLVRNDTRGNLLTRSRRKAKVKRMEKPKTFAIMTELANEPAHIWVILLDDIVKKVSSVKETHPWESWKYFPDILACTAWQVGEDRFAKNLNGDLVIDWNRIERMKQVFLQIPADIATRAVTFFLTINYAYSADPSFRFSDVKSMIQTLNLSKRGKTLLKDGAISAILKTYLRKGMR